MLSSGNWRHGPNPQELRLDIGLRAARPLPRNWSSGGSVHRGLLGRSALTAPVQFVETRHP